MVSTFAGTSLYKRDRHKDGKVAAPGIITLYRCGRNVTPLFQGFEASLGGADSSHCVPFELERPLIRPSDS